jgi:hypothetical protein
MPSYLVESYLPRGGAEELEAAAVRASGAARALSLQGRRVRYLRSALLPGDELCLHLFEADSAALVSAASELAGITAERVVEAVLDPASRDRQSKEEP